jgi:hypothetical protein
MHRVLGASQWFWAALQGVVHSSCASRGIQLTLVLEAVVRYRLATVAGQPHAWGWRRGRQGAVTNISTSCLCKRSPLVHAEGNAPYRRRRHCPHPRADPPWPTPGHIQRQAHRTTAHSYGFAPTLLDEGAAGKHVSMEHAVLEKKGLAPHLAELGQVRRIVLGHRFKRRHLLQTTHTHTHTHTRTHTLTHFVENSSCQQLRVPLHRGRRWRPPLQHASAARAPTACRIAASTESDDRPTRRSRIRTQENK